MINRISRREGLLAGLFGTGYIGLRALATGLPTWYLLNPRRATAQDLQCAINAKANLQYLVLAASSNGDPMNCNCPGTYEAADIIHPQQAEVEATQVTLGGKSYGAALPWADPSVIGSDAASTGQLGSAVLARTAFFHHRTGTTVHGDQPKVMKLLGDTSGGEMFVSAYAKHLSTCFGTVQAAPIALGARGNSSELVSFAGRMLPSISPTQLKQLLTGSKTDPLVQLRSIRDASLNQLNDLAKTASNDVQKQFLDRLVTSQTQVRALADQLATTLSAITTDDVKGQGLAAAALIAANVTPVVTMHIGFGGDNHTDANLQAEADQHVSGVAGIQQLMTSLAGLTDSAGVSLTDRVTFATMNVFGRNLNGISKVTSRAGRDHYGNHSVMVMIGKNVKAGVYGGVVASGSGGAYVAGTWTPRPARRSTGGDIPAATTHVSAAAHAGRGARHTGQRGRGRLRGVGRRQGRHRGPGRLAERLTQKTPIRSRVPGFRKTGAAEADGPRQTGMTTWRPCRRPSSPRRRRPSWTSWPSSPSWPRHRRCHRRGRPRRGRWSTRSGGELRAR